MDDVGIGDPEASSKSKWTWLLGEGSVCLHPAGSASLNASHALQRSLQPKAEGEGKSSLSCSISLLMSAASSATLGGRCSRDSSSFAAPSSVARMSARVGGGHTAPAATPR